VVIPRRAADARSSDRACVWRSCGWERGPSSRTKTGRHSTRPGQPFEHALCGQLPLRSICTRHTHWLVSVSNPAPRHFYHAQQPGNGWMRCQGRGDGARVGGSGRSFASGCASNRRRRRPQRQEQRRVGPLPTATSASHPEPASRELGRTTALISAASNGHTPVVEQLIAAGAGLDVQYNEGYGRCADCIGRYSTRQLTSRKGHCAHLGRVEGPHTLGRAAHRRRRETRCPEQLRVRPLCRLHRPHAVRTGD
jgi:hypothetical protein